MDARKHTHQNVQEEPTINSNVLWTGPNDQHKSKDIGGGCDSKIHEKFETVEGNICNLKYWSRLCRYHWHWHLQRLIGGGILGGIGELIDWR